MHHILMSPGNEESAMATPIQKPSYLELEQYKPELPYTADPRR